MKRLVLSFLMIAVVTGGLLFAQGRRGASGANPRTAAEKTAVSGVLGIARGQIAVQSEGKTYYLMGLNRFIGFIDGLKEGASVQLEGYNLQTGNRRSSDEAYLRVTSLTLGGKTYDLDNGFMDFGGFGMNQFMWNNAPRMNNRIMPPSPPFQQQQRRNNSRRR